MNKILVIISVIFLVSCSDPRIICPEGLSNGVRVQYKLDTNVKGFIVYCRPSYSNVQTLFGNFNWNHSLYERVSDG